MGSKSKSKSKHKSCGSTFENVFDTENVLILVWGIVMILLLSLFFYARGQKDIREKYSVRQETSVASVDEIIGVDGSLQYSVSASTDDNSRENTLAYAAESAKNRNQCIIYFVASVAIFFCAWFVVCFVCSKF